MYKPDSLTERKAEELGITPEDAERLGCAATKILDNPFKGEGIFARRWVDGWYAGFKERRDKGTSSA